MNLSGIHDFNANNVIIDSDIVNQQTHGAVIITRGTCSIRTSQNFTINKDFEVKEGASFVVTNQ